MCYLLDKLHCYENDYSDALALTSQEADALFAGEAALVRPASTEALCMAHGVLMADVAVLHSDVLKQTTLQAAILEEQAAISRRQAEISEDMKDVCQSLCILSDMVQEALVSHIASPRDTDNVRFIGECTPIPC